MKLRFGTTASLRLIGVLLLVSVLVCHFHDGTCCNDHTITVITVDPLNGNDSENCIGGTHSCRTLEFTFSERYQCPFTKYFFTVGTHILNVSNVTFKELTSLSFIGNSSTIQCTKGNTGLAFFKVTDVFFSDLTFTNCSASRMSTSRNYNESVGVISSFQVGLYFYECMNITMEYVNVIDSPSATGVVMYDTSGTNRISDCVFHNNQLNPPVSESSSPHGGGGGFYVEFTYCNLTQMKCNNSDLKKEIVGATYSFERCNFTGNIANDSGNSTYIVPHHNDHEAFGRGGGLSIFVKGNSHDNNLNIDDCLFSNNRALWGAGLFVEFHDTTFNNKVNVSNSNFSNNSCPYTAHSGTAGGGMRIGHYVYGDKKIDGNGNWINIEKCKFVNNRALNGGGLSISATPQDNTTSTNQLSWVTITDCEFEQNTGRLGSAIHVDRFQLILIGQILNITIRRSSFTKNSISFLHNYADAYQLGVGTIFVHNVPTHFLESANFTDNDGSGLAIVVGEANFCSCSASFVNNTGNNGGGIALLGEAYIKVDNYTTMTFTNNRAAVHGGGIYNKYISRENLDSYTQCFIRHHDAFKRPDEWGADFTFSGNKDLGNRRKSAIHTTSILPCSWAGGSGVNKNKSAIFCWNGWTYKNEGGDSVNCREEINTDVGDIKKRKQLITAYPGHPFNLDLDIQDDLGKEKNKYTDIESVFIASTKHNSKSSSHNQPSFFHAWEDGAVLKEKGNVTLILDTVEDRVWQISVVVQLQACPPGFTYSSNSTKNVSCTCNTAKNYDGAIFCDYNNFTALLRNGYWIGQVSPDKNDNSYFVSLCPVGYCYASDHSSFFKLNKTAEEVDRQICGKHNRNGILCGECIKGFGPAINSRTFECVVCNRSNVSTSQNIFKYVAAVYIPNTVMFISIIAFKIRLTTGAANAFILYSQFVSSTFNLDAEGQISINLFLNKHTGILKTYRFIYGIFNLEFFENLLSPLCVGEGLSTLTIISTDYAVAVTPMIMILFTVIVTKVADFVGSCCSRSREHSEDVNSAVKHIRDVTRYMNKALLSAFAAYLLLSYTKFSLTSSYILQTEPLIDEYGDVSNQQLRVYYDGTLAADSKQYISRYVVPSYIILVVFVVIPPILLLDYPLRAFEWCLMKVDILWHCYPAGKVHVFLDTFQGCFKPNFRFFAGLYFLFRLTISVNFIVSRSLLQQYTVQQIACIIMVIFLAICQPYNKENKLFNYVDILIFSNLAIVNALTLYLYEYTKSNETKKPPVSAFVVQYILVYLPLVYILFYVLWLLCKIKPCRQLWNKLVSDKVFKRSKRYAPLGGERRDNNLTVTHTEVSRGIEESLTSEAVILRRAEMTNTYRPANVDVMSTINEEQVLRHETEGMGLAKSNAEEVGLQSVCSTPANCYGSTGGGGSHHSENSSACRSSRGSSNSSQCHLGVQIERGQSWPMQ